MAQTCKLTNQKEVTWLCYFCAHLQTGSGSSLPGFNLVANEKNKLPPTCLWGNNILIPLQTSEDNLAGKKNTVILDMLCWQGKHTINAFWYNKHTLKLSFVIAWYPIPLEFRINYQKGYIYTPNSSKLALQGLARLVWLLPYLKVYCESNERGMVQLLLQKWSEYIHNALH